MRRWIYASLVWVSLASASFSDSQADSKELFNNGASWNGVSKELFTNFDTNWLNITFDDLSEKTEILLPIDAKIITQAALDYFDQEVKLYSLNWEARENVQVILMEYLSKHPILKRKTNWEIIFSIDNKQEFASMIKHLANTLFDWMPKIIRTLAILIAFWSNEELQNTLDNLDSTVLNLPIKQYNDIVFDYFWWIIRRVCDTVGWTIIVWDYYDSVYKYYPNKNHAKILDSLNKSWQSENNIVDLEYPFKNNTAKHVA